jgi:DNA-binding transcriptional ArsR family regulator
MQSFESKARAFAALGCGKRLEIMEMLLKDRKCCSNLSECTGLDASTISRHMKELQDSGLVKVRKEGKHAFYEVRNKKLLLKMIGIAERIGSDKND